jgi:nicotinate-nucleotide pyrophosphorylase (carboxylating)
VTTTGLTTAGLTSPVATITTLAQAAELVSSCGLDAVALDTIVKEALDEDLGGRGVLRAGAGAGVDVTSVATIPASAETVADFIARAPGIFVGGPVAAYVMALVCAEAGAFQISLLRADGQEVAVGDVLLTVHGNTRAVLRAERVALNLVTLMSGVATATRSWVDALAGSRTRIRDSRKTVPGLRMLQKYAVRTAGGVNHRMSLADAALIKDNHVIAAGGVVPAYEAVRRAFPDIHVQVEVTSPDQARDVVAAGASDVLLDNMGLDQMAAVVRELGTAATFEASGGLTLASALRIAETGVDFVAVGAITHSPHILDIALDLRT